MVEKPRLQEYREREGLDLAEEQGWRNKMVMGMDFGEGRSPYMERRDRTFGRRGGRPVGTTGAITGQVKRPGAKLGGETPTGSGIQPTMGQTPYAGFLQELTKPIEYKGRAEERFRAARGQIQAGTKMEMGQMEKYMGGRGFRGGESGIADVAMGRVARGGAERLGQASQQIAESEAARAQGYAGLELQRKLGAGGLALTGEEGAMDRMMQYYGGRQVAERAEWTPWWQGMASGGGY